MDGHGYITGFSQDGVNTWWRYGVATAPQATNGFPGPGAAINQTGIWEALRRATHWVRWIDRTLFRGYAVENGKSMLWFARYLNVNGVDIDVWVGLLNAIASTAQQKGWSNRWVLDVMLIPGVDSDASPWKPSAYGDIFAMPCRCATYAYGFPPSQEHADIAASGQLNSTVVEIPPGYRYMPLLRFSDQIQTWEGGGNLNDAQTTDAPQFYKSCRIYEPPVEVESVELDGSEVKVTLTSRLHYADTAPTSIDRDRSTWNISDILAEGYRTIENGLRLYLLWQDGGAWPAAQPGDHALVPQDTQYPDAAILPRFLFLKLIPTPYDDGNDTQDDHDTPLWHDVWQQLEFYIRAICEGFIDPDSLNTIGICQSDGTTKGRGPVLLRYDKLASAVASRVNLCGTSQSVRSDYFRLTAPGPNMIARAEVYNAFESALQQLRYIPIWLPWRILIYWAQHTGELIVPAANVSSCTAAADQSPWTTYYWWTGTPPNPSNTSVIYNWDEIDTVTLQSIPIGRTIALEPYGSDWKVTHVVNEVQIKIEPISADLWEAIPDHLRSYVQTIAETWFCAQHIQTIPVITQDWDGCRYNPSTSTIWERLEIQQQGSVPFSSAPQNATCVYAYPQDPQSSKPWEDIIYLYAQNHPITLILDVDAIP